MSIVYIPRGKRLHINANNGNTLCKKPIPKEALTWDDYPKDGWFCPKCMQEVGYLMLGDYLGTDSLTGKTVKQLLSAKGEMKK